MFSTSTPSFLETLSRIHSSDQNGLTQIAYEMTNVTEHFATDFLQFKANTAKRIDKTERLIRTNVMGYDTLDIKQPVELLRNKNNRLRMESKSLLKVIELLSGQQTNTREITTNKYS